MPNIGLKYPVYSVLTETGVTPTYANGAVVAKAITANVSVESSNAALYSDDGISETDASFLKGTVSLNVDDLSDAVRIALLGYDEGVEVDAAISSNELSAGALTSPAIVGIGFYGKRVKNNVVSYRAIWLKKVQFKEPATDYKTKGESVEFQTPTIEGTIMMCCDSKWKEEGTFSTENGAIAWLNAKSGISSGVSQGLTALSIANCTLTPSFSPTVFNYYGAAATNPAIVATAAGVIKLYVNGFYNQTLTSGVAGVEVVLSTGATDLYEIVIQESGKKEIVTRIMMHDVS